MRVDLHLSDDLGTALRGHADGTGQTVSDVARRAIARVVSEPGPYRFGADGSRGPSLIADYAAVNGFADGEAAAEARDRLRRFEAWSEDMYARFATVTTTSASGIIPPGYRVVADLVFAADRPLVAAANRATVSDATPFVAPILEGGVVSPGFDVIDEARTEGNPPAEGTLDPEQRTVAPTVRTGVIALTRELVDAASPMGDIVAMTAAAEDYRRSVETLAYAELNQAQGGTITAGFVPSGAQVRVSTAAALYADLKVALADYAAVRRRKARNVIVGGTTAPTQLAPELDDSTGDDDAAARIGGARVNWATATFGAAAGDADVIVLSDGDFWVFESPLLRFRYEEKRGPAVVEAGVWAYAAAEMLRPRGLSVIRHT